MSTEFEALKKIHDAFMLDEDMEPPPLHEDLEDCLWTSPGGLQFVKHPLVCTLYTPIGNAHLNAHYAYKREALEAAINAKAFDSVVFLHERPWRAEALYDVSQYLDDGDYWELTRSVWIDSENIWQNVDLWYELLSSDRPFRHRLMDIDERTKLEHLPDTFKVWRGTSAPDGRGAMFSWTLLRDRAAWFAARYLLPGQSAVLLEAEVRRDDVVAVFTSRSEEEVVLLPEDVQDLSVTEL